jgi:hypothetical protein
MVYVAMMLCRLFGKKSPTHFPAEWPPLLHEAAEGYSFNWNKILSDNLAQEVMEYQTVRSNGRPIAFFLKLPDLMEIYILSIQERLSV